GSRKVTGIVTDADNREPRNLFLSAEWIDLAKAFADCCFHRPESLSQRSVHNRDVGAMRNLLGSQCASRKNRKPESRKIVSEHRPGVDRWSLPSFRKRYAFDFDRLQASPIEWRWTRPGYTFNAGQRSQLLHCRIV